MQSRKSCNPFFQIKSNFNDAHSEAAQHIDTANGDGTRSKTQTKQSPRWSIIRGETSKCPH